MSIIKSASLILVNKIHKNIGRNDFKLLLQKRLATSQSFADKMVFPGGALDKCDFSEEWNKLLQKYFTPTQLKGVTCESELMIYKNSKELSNNKPEIFYRICAIRETFEETGILLARDRSHKSISTNRNLLDDIIKNEWQKKVLKNGNLFIELFKSYKLFPDLFSLYEWSEWLTPSIINRRFHTAFYMVISDVSLATNANEGESDLLIWGTPQELLDVFSSSKGLAPPQLSELSELNVLRSWRDVHTEAVKRQKRGGENNIGFMIILSDGAVMVLPGDSRYPADFTGESVEMKHLSVEDFSNDEYLRRAINIDGKFVYQCNLNSWN